MGASSGYGEQRAVGFAHALAPQPENGPEMKAMTTLLDRIFTAVTCILGWAVFPLFIAFGAIALFIYAFIAEVLSPASGGSDALDAERLADHATTGIHLRETLQP